MFFSATSNASLDISIAVIDAFLNSFASDIAMQPDPVPISKIFNLRFLFL